MKKKIMFLTISCLCLGLLACKPTPSTKVVINQNNDGLENAINTEASVNKYEAPSIYNYEFQEDKLNVKFNADVQIPKAVKFPVVKVKNAEFTQEQVNKIATYLTQGKPLLDSKMQTKDELEKQYIQYKALIEDVKKNPQNYDMSLQEYEDNLALLEERIKNAPETKGDVIVDTTLVLGVKGSNYLSVNADLGKKSPAKLYIKNSLGQGSVSFINGPKYTDVSLEYPELMTQTPKNVTVSKDDALKIAVNAIKGIGADNMELALSTVGAISKKGENDALKDLTEQCYIFYYTPALNGIKTTFYPQGPAVQEESAYNQIIKYERIMICVDDSGLVSLDWSAYRKITENKTDNVELLTFDKVMENCRQQLKNKYSWVEGHKSCEILVNKVTLGYMLIAQKNDNEYNLMVPVWDFYGEVAYDGGKYEDTGCYSLLTINAIDGGNIDRNLGY